MDADVIVLGAGAAGLAAARALAAASLRVVVVEARDRIGGRVMSHPTPRATTPAELGAEYIHGPAPETMALLRTAGAAAVDVNGDGWISVNGRLEPLNDRFVAAAAIFEQSLDRPDETIDAFLARFAADATMRDTVIAARAFAEGFDAVDPAIASVRAVALEIASGVDSISARAIGGYPVIFRTLNDGCTAAGVTTLLSTAVRRVAWGPDGVTVEAVRANAATVTLRAHAAVVTLPVGVLQHRGDATSVTFEPALPAVKLAALGNIAMGDVVKVMLRFRTAVWEEVEDGRYRDGGFFRAENERFPAYWTQYPIRSELIAAWAGGPRATAMAGLSEAEIVESALDGFAAMFGDPQRIRAAFEEGTMHDWIHDPFARGAYSYVIAGGGDARVELATPIENRLYFAGEATMNDGEGGTVNGALVSGERAAREILAVLQHA
jgi:monoamine oxidase